MSVWRYDMPVVCFDLFDILKMCGERKTHNPPSGVSHKVFHCAFATLRREPSSTTLGVVLATATVVIVIVINAGGGMVGIVSGGLWMTW